MKQASTPSNPDGLDGEDNQRIRAPKPQTDLQTRQKTPALVRCESDEQQVVVCIYVLYSHTEKRGEMLTRDWASTKEATENYY